MDAKLDSHGFTRPRWWLPAALLLLAAAALVVDTGIAAALRSGPLHDGVSAVQLVVRPWLGLAMLVAIVLSFRRERMARGALLRIAVAAGCGVLFVWLKSRYPSSDPFGAVVHFLEPLIGWGLVLSLLAMYPNRERIVPGFLAAVFLSTAITHTFKWTVGRARPETGFGLLHFSLFHNGAGTLESFPSGHSSAVAVLAMLLATYFPLARWVLPFVVLDVGLERIVSDKHFLSDVLAGYATGVIAYYACVRLLGPGFFSKRPRSAETMTQGASAPEPPPRESHEAAQ